MAIAGIMVVGLTLSTDVANAQGPSGGDRRAIIQSLSDEEKQKFFAMSPEEKQKFFTERGKKSGGGKAAAKSGGAAKNGGGRRGRGGRGGQRPPPLVELAKVQTAPLIRIFPITGRLVPRQQGAVAARIEGRVANILVQIGERVKKGQVLAQLSRDRLKLEADLREAEVNQARAKLKSAQAQVTLINQEVKRLAGLRKSAAFSQARYEDKRQEAVKASAQVEETAAALARARVMRDLARIDLRDAAIRAPFPGAVIIRHVSAGAYIKLGSPVATLLDDQSLEIEADVPSDKLDDVKPGDEITVRLGTKKKMKAKLRAIVPDENPLSRTRAVRLTPEVASQGGARALVANQSVVIEIPSGNGREVVAIPKDAIVDRQNKKMVFVFERGSVRPITVKIGKSFAGKFEVLSGVEAGQTIVVTGNELLRPGQRVRVKGAKGGPSGGPRGGGAGNARRSGSPGAGGGGERRAVFRSMTPEERQKLFKMPPEEKQKFIEKKMRALKAPET